MLSAPRSCGTRIIRVRFVLPLHLFPVHCHRPKFPLFGRDNALPQFHPLSSYADAWFSFSLRDRRCFTLDSLSLLSPFCCPSFNTLLFYRSLCSDRRSFVLSRRFVCDRGLEATLLMLRVTNPRFFRSFFRTKISTFRGETRTRFGVAQKKKERERNTVKRHVRTKGR